MGKADGPPYVSSVQSLSHVQFLVTHGLQCASLPCPSPTLELAQTHIRRVSDAIQPSHPLSSPSLLPSVLPSIRVFSSESVLCIRWPKYWNFNFSISPSNEYPRLSSFRIDWLDLLQLKELSRVFSNTTVQKHQFFNAQLSLWSNSHVHS